MAHNFGIAKLSQQSLDLMKQTKNMSLPDRIKHIPHDCQWVTTKDLVTITIESKQDPELQRFRKLHLFIDGATRHRSSIMIRKQLPIHALRLFQNSSNFRDYKI